MDFTGIRRYDTRRGRPAVAAQPPGGHGPSEEGPLRVNIAVPALVIEFHQRALKKVGVSRAVSSSGDSRALDLTCLTHNDGNAIVAATGLDHRPTLVCLFLNLRLFVQSIVRSH